jgi:hypothetical protein
MNDVNNESMSVARYAWDRLLLQVEESNLTYAETDDGHNEVTKKSQRARPQRGEAEAVNRSSFQQISKSPSDDSVTGDRSPASEARRACQPHR